MLGCDRQKCLSCTSSHKLVSASRASAVDDRHTLHSHSTLPFPRAPARHLLEGLDWSHESNRFRCCSTCHTSCPMLGDTYWDAYPGGATARVTKESKGVMVPKEESSLESSSQNATLRQSLCSDLERIASEKAEEGYWAQYGDGGADY